MNDQEFDTYPFTEIDSYFGGYELLNDKNIKWNTVTKNKLSLLVLPKNEFLKIFSESDLK
jgi:hypothetical protein